MFVSRIDRNLKLVWPAPFTMARLDPLQRRQPVLSHVALSAVMASEG